MKVTHTVAVNISEDADGNIGLGPSGDVDLAEVVLEGPKDEVSGKVTLVAGEVFQPPLAGVSVAEGLFIESTGDVDVTLNGNLLPMRRGTAKLDSSGTPVKAAKAKLFIEGPVTSLSIVAIEVASVAYAVWGDVEGAVAPPNLATAGSQLVFYISPTGSDETGDGSQTRPWATTTPIAKMFEAVQRPMRSVKCIMLAGTYGTAFASAFRSHLNVPLDFYQADGGFILEGETNLIGQVVSTGGGTIPDAVNFPCRTQIPIGAHSLAIVPGETFLVQNVPGIGDFWYPVVSAVSPNILVHSSVPAFFAGAGETFRVVSLRVTIAEADIRYGGEPDAGAFRLRGFKTGDGFLTCERLNVEGVAFSGLGQSKFTDCSVMASSWNAIDQNPASGAKVAYFYGRKGGLFSCRWTAAGPIDFESANADFYEIEHLVAMANLARQKFRFRGTRIQGITSYPVHVGGQGTAIELDACAYYEARNIHTCAAQGKLANVKNHAVWDNGIGAGGGAGSCTSNTMTLSKGGRAIGVESRLGAITSTPAGQDIVVGGKAAQTWASLPANDTGLGEATAQGCFAD